MDATYDINENIAAQDEDTKSEVIQTTDTENNVTDAEVEKADEIESTEAVDYEALVNSDLEVLKSEFPELQDISDITDLNNPLRYAALRDLGLSPAEAYMATAKRRAQDTRSHLRSAHGKNAAANVGMMSQYELATARDLFPGLSDLELQRLYKKVTK